MGANRSGSVGIRATRSITCMRLASVEGTISPMPILLLLLSPLFAIKAWGQPARSANDFGLEVHRSLQDTGNLFLSPWSIYTALAMTYAGARGETEKEMARTLRFSAGQKAAHAGVAESGRRLDSIAAAGKVRIERANAIWCQRDLPVVDSFLAIQKRHYSAGFQLADFVKQPDVERLSINKWAEDRTQGRIKDLIPPGSITPLTSIVLCNAIWFKGHWAARFNPTLTAPADFHLFDGKLRKVPLMSMKARFRHAEGKGWAALELPYVDTNLSMLVILPAAPGPKALKALESQIGKGDANDPLKRLGKAKPKPVTLFLPRFKLICDYNLGSILPKLGMKRAFADADFSGMVQKRKVKISAVFHKAFVEVNEEGSEAAAATAVVMVVGSARLTVDAVFRADRPFVFLIRENRSGLILFSGRVTDPGT